MSYAYTDREQIEESFMYETASIYDLPELKQLDQEFDVEDYLKGDIDYWREVVCQSRELHTIGRKCPNLV